MPSDIFSPHTLKNINVIANSITEPAKLEQMAEECSELTQALLKKARKIRGENYTPKSISYINDNITEEFTDVMLCALTLDLRIDTQIMDSKLQRWIDRNGDKI